MLRPAFASCRRVAATGIRGYAAKASAQPPVQLFGLDGSYASALYTASAKDSSIETTAKSLASLKELLTSDKKLETILADPSLSASDKKEIVETIVSAAKIDKTTANFLQVLADNNRLPLIDDVLKKFEVLNNAHKGLVEATVTSAAPLDSKILSKLEAAISKSAFVGSGKTLKLTNAVNPDILGGLVVEVAERTVDLSISSRIAKYNQLLNEAV